MVSYSLDELAHYFIGLAFLSVMFRVILVIILARDRLASLISSLSLLSCQIRPHLIFEGSSVSTLLVIADCIYKYCLYFFGFGEVI